MFHVEALGALNPARVAAVPLEWVRSVQPGFIGGGMPCLFLPASIDALLAMVRARIRLAAGAEITLEANPGTFETGRFADFARAGVTRLSIGVQSFDDRLLRSNGRDPGPYTPPTPPTTLPLRLDGVACLSDINKTS